MKTVEDAMEELSEVGGKARTLFELARAGFRVPRFVCVSAGETGQNSVFGVPASAGPGSDGIEAALRRPPEGGTTNGGSVDWAGCLEISQVLGMLGTPVAVRSSASAEDGREVSFAGQFRSFLNLRTVEEVDAAIEACHESLGAPAVREYCRRHGIDPESLRMTAIVQEMVEPELAGVAFTVNPATGAEEVVIEACEGLADDLLSGRKAALGADHPLMRRYAPEIERIARQIQRHFGAPQDVEFAIENGNVYVLQARPVTRINFAPEIGEWTNADFRDGGVACDVCTPLMWSLYEFVWQPALNGFLREIRLSDDEFEAGRMFFGRPYWNLGEVKRRLATLPGFDEREFDRDLSVQSHDEREPLRTAVTLRGLIRVLPTVAAIQSVWSGQEKFDREFLNGGFERLLRPFEAIGKGEGASSCALEDRFRELIEQVYFKTELNYFRTIYCASLAKLDFMDAFPDADYAALVAGLPALSHFEPVNALRELRSSGVAGREAFVRRFRHHSRRELDIRAPRWDEDAEWIDTLVRAVAGRDACDTAGQDAQPPAGKACSTARARVEALKSLPWWRRWKFERKLDRLRTFLWLREEMRDRSSRTYYWIRRYVLAISERRGLGDDIFFMSYKDILSDDRSNVLKNRERYESYRNYRAPNEIGARFRVESNRAEKAGRLRGIGASRGIVRGIARVARSVEEAVRVENGAILVCPFTDPGWTPVLDRVSAVVTETGGLLSHAAVICREFGIPAVLGIPSVTERIEDGSHVVVRGSEGTVELITT